MVAAPTPSPIARGVALRGDRAGEWTRLACEESRPTAPPCIALCASQSVYPVATCERGLCVGLVPAEQPWARCANDSDCVAAPRDCGCMSGGCDGPRARFVGVNVDELTTYASVVCGPGVSLPDCDTSSADVRCVWGGCTVLGGI